MGSFTYKGEISILVPNTFMCTENMHLILKSLLMQLKVNCYQLFILVQAMMSNEI